MSPRELIIFLLGLAIVAVILRGLYVAMQARRGQIKLVIDKNTITDINKALIFFILISYFSIWLIIFCKAL